MPTVNLGRVGFVNKGTYIGNTTVYKVNDIVKYNSSVYVCIQAHSTANLPTNVIYWQVWVDVANYYIKSEVDNLLLTEMGTPIASGATTSIGGVTAGDTIHITGTTSITSLGLSTTGAIRTLIFDGVLSITNNPTTLILPGNTNIVTVVGSSAAFVCENGSLGYWRCTSLNHQSVSMAELGYISNITSDAQTQLNSIVATSVPRDSATGAAYIPAGTTAQRPVAPASGYMRFNTSLLTTEVWNGTLWTPAGAGATGGGSDTVFVETSFAVTQNYTITTGKSAITIGNALGNVTIADDAIITIPDNSIWLIQGV